MPKFIVDGMRDGSNDPLYVEAANADEALSKAQAKGMHTTGVRPAKSIQETRGLPFGLICLTGIASLYIEHMGKGSPFVSILFAYLAMLSMRDQDTNSQTTIQKLQEEVAALRAIVNEQRTTDLREPSLSS